MKRNKHKKFTVMKNYRDYIKSKLWIKRKNRYFGRYGKKCEACGFNKFITLHHAKYTGEYGNESDSEVYALCKRCHNLFHQSFELKPDMIEETLLFIKEMQKTKLILKEVEKLDDLSFI